MFERSGTTTNTMGFVNDMKVFARSNSTKENHCRMLENDGLNRHGAVFTLRKYQLIHLAKTPKKVNMGATIKLGCSGNSSAISLMAEIRMLVLQIDPRPKWGPQRKTTQMKLSKKSLAVTKISASTREATFAKAKRPAMTYGWAQWHSPEVEKNIQCGRK